MENIILTEIDRKVLWHLHTCHLLPPRDMTKEQYSAVVYHLADLGLVKVISDIGGFIIDYIVTEKGVYCLINK